MTACIQMAIFMSYTLSNMYIYTSLCRYWITLYRYLLIFIVPHVDIELEDNKQFISNIPRRYMGKNKPRPLAAMFFDDHDSLNNLGRGSPKTFLPSYIEIGPLVSDKKIF